MANFCELDALNFLNLVKFRIGFGDKEQVFTVHKSKPKTLFACGASPVLKTAFNIPFREGKEQTYILQDVDAEIFNRFVLSVYTRTVVATLINGYEMELPSKEAQENFDEEVMKLMKLWVLGDKLLMPQLQNEVMVVITKLGRRGKCHLKSTSWIPYIWNYTNAGSPIRRFFHAHVIRWVEKAHCLQHHKDFPQELLMDVLIRAQEINTILDKKAEIRQLWNVLQTESDWLVPQL